MNIQNHKQFWSVHSMDFQLVLQSHSGHFSYFYDFEMIVPQFSLSKSSFYDIIVGFKIFTPMDR